MRRTNTAQNVKRFIEKKIPIAKIKSIAKKSLARGGARHQKRRGLKYSKEGKTKSTIINRREYAFKG